MKRYYAVQVGNDYSYDFDGSSNRREAFRIARRYAKDPSYAGQEIRVVDVDVVNGVADYCNAEYIVREGRGGDLLR